MWLPGLGETRAGWPLSDTGLQQLDGVTVTCRLVSANASFTPQCDNTKSRCCDHDAEAIGSHVFAPSFCLKVTYGISGSSAPPR